MSVQPSRIKQHAPPVKASADHLLLSELVHGVPVPRECCPSVRSCSDWGASVLEEQGVRVLSPSKWKCRHRKWRSFSCLSTGRPPLLSLTTLCCSAMLSRICGQSRYSLHWLSLQPAQMMPAACAAHLCQQLPVLVGRTLPTPNGIGNEQQQHKPTPGVRNLKGPVWERLPALYEGLHPSFGPCRLCGIVRV